MAKRQLKGQPINDENSFIIDKCEACGFVSYNPIAECPQCGNKILTGVKTDKRTWVQGAVKETLKQKGYLKSESTATKLSEEENRRNPRTETGRGPSKTHR